MKHADFTGKATTVLLLAVLVLSAGLRLWQLDRPALWEDDYFNLDRGLMGLREMFHAQKFAGPTDTFHDYQPPLFYALLHVALSVSQSSLAARLVSFLAGMLTLFGLYRAGASLFGTRAGLFAALLAGLSLFHIEASRGIKTYSVYLCASIWALYFLHEAVARARTRLWAAYVPCAAAMVYSSFLGVPGLAAQLAFAGTVLIWEAARGVSGWRSRAVFFLGACLAVLLLCLPWIGAITFIREMFYNAAVDPLAGFSWTKARELAEGFLSHVFETPPWLWAGLPLLSAFGIFGALTERRSKALMLVLVWAGLPAVAVLTSRTEMNSVLSTRHFYNIFGMLILLAGYGAAVLPHLLFRRPLTARAGVPVLLLGLALCLASSAHGLLKLPEYYARSISFDREVAYWLYAMPGRAQYLDVQGWKRSTKRFAMNWYLPGLFLSAGDMEVPTYRRMLVLENAFGKGMPGPVPEASRYEGFSFGPFGVGFSHIGLVNRSPLVVRPDVTGRFIYSDDFSGIDIQRDACSLHNASTDTRLGVLLPTSWAKPGSATYRFVLPRGLEVAKLDAVLKSVLYKRHPASPSKAALEVWAGPRLDALQPAGRITLDDFSGLPAHGCEALEEIPIYGACARTTKRWDITSLAGNGREFFVRINLLPGQEEGYLFVDGFELDARTLPGTAATEDAFTLELKNLLANNRVQPWRPGAVALDGLFAFAARPGLAVPGQPLGAPEDLPRFQAEHPGLAPVHVLKDEFGQPAAYFFDPPLELSARVPNVAESGNGQGFAVKGLVFSGKLDVPSLLVGSTRVDIPVVAPGGSVLMLNPGGHGRLIWSPDFSKGVFGSLDFSSADNLRPSPDGDNDGGLTCLEERPCFFAARFVSALPMKTVRLEWYPRVVADPEGRNVVRLSYSTDDGKTFEPLEEFTGSRTGKWTALFGKHTRTLTFKAPINHFLLKAELSGEAAQLWSHQRVVDRMWMEAELDARSIEPFDLPEGAFSLGLVNPAGNDVAVRFLDKPMPFFDAIKDWR